MITVWLPGPEAETIMGGLPEGFRADVWIGTTADLPGSTETVEVVIPPFEIENDQLSVLARLPRLRLVQLESVGADWILPHIPPGVILCNARGAYDSAVAEWIIAAVLAHLRRLPFFAEAQRKGRWEFAPSDSLEGKTVLLVGHGSIGTALEPILGGFGAKVIGVAAHPRPDVHAADELPALVPEADIVVLLLPGTTATKGLVNAEFLGWMRDGTLLVNASRGPVIDTAALLRELRTGRLHAALDVTDPEPLPSGHPLWSAPGVMLTPHVAGSNGRTMAKAMVLARDQLVRYAAGEQLLNIVGPEGY
jgi:phosphoglycerate dehydrogenase-like enzyme